MTLILSEEQAFLKDTAKKFAQEKTPTTHFRQIRDTENPECFDRNVWQEMAAQGWSGILIPEKYGGSNFGLAGIGVVLEELGRTLTPSPLFATSVVCATLLNKSGNEYQKKEYLTSLARGEKLGGFCLSEPEAGSDATSQKTSAIDKGDYFLLNGTKNWITNAQTADVFIVIAQSDYELGHKGINAFIVERKWNGVEVGPKENKLGIRGSDTNSVMFNDVKVPKKNMLGKNGEGFKIAMKTLSGGRIGIAAQALGIASGSYDLALNYSKERKAFGKPISHHQAVAFKLSDMITGIEAGRLLCLKAAWNKDNNISYDIEGAMAKVFCSELSMKAASEAIQIHGGYGYVKEYHVERMLRDAKITEIYEGTSEIQRIVISRGVIKKS